MERKILGKGNIRVLGVFWGMLLLLSFSLAFTQDVYAQGSTKTIQERSESEGTVQGTAEVDVDGVAKNGKAKASVITSSGTTTQVGTGLNDKLSKNAKTGDVMDLKWIPIFALAVIVLGVLIIKRKNKEMWAA